MTSDDEVKLICHIACGLLASGQFTHPHKDGTGEITLKTYDHGPDWKDDGVPRRYQPEVVDVAEWVFRVIKEDVDHRQKTGESKP